MIQVTEKYWLWSDERQWVIGIPYKRKDGRIQYSGLFFYSNFGSMAKALLHLQLRLCDAQSIKELHKAVIEAERRVCNLLQGAREERATSKEASKQ